MNATRLNCRAFISSMYLLSEIQEFYGISWQLFQSLFPSFAHGSGRCRWLVNFTLDASEFPSEPLLRSSQEWLAIFDYVLVIRVASGWHGWLTLPDEQTITNDFWLNCPVTVQWNWIKWEWEERRARTQRLQSRNTENSWKLTLTLGCKGF